jgi:hypothetical protein
MVIQDSTKPLLTGVSLNDEGNVVIYFQNTPAHEDGVTKLAVHAASALFYYLIIHYKADQESVTRFIKMAFMKDHAKAAIEHSRYDPDTGTVSIAKEAQSFLAEEDDLQEVLDAGFIDLSILQTDEPEVERAQMLAGVLFDHDENTDMGSMNTRQFARHNGMDVDSDEETETEGTSKAYSGYAAAAAAAASQPVPDTNPGAKSPAPAGAASATGQDANASQPTTGMPPPPKEGVVGAEN